MPKFPITRRRSSTCAPLSRTSLLPLRVYFDDMGLVFISKFLASRASNRNRAQLFFQGCGGRMGFALMPGLRHIKKEKKRGFWPGVIARVSMYSQLAAIAFK